MKEKVLVSACLLGVNCKYNGENNENAKVLKYVENKEVIPVCPEIMGGLSTPRDPSERVGEKVLSNKGKDVTENYQRGATETVNLAKKLNVKKAILKARSPSCGNKEIYDGTFSKTKTKRDGVTAEMLKKNGIIVLTEEDLEIERKK